MLQLRGATTEDCWQSAAAQGVGLTCDSLVMQNQSVWLAGATAIAMGGTRLWVAMPSCVLVQREVVAGDCTRPGVRDGPPRFARFASLSAIAADDQQRFAALDGQRLILGDPWRVRSIPLPSAGPPPATSPVGPKAGSRCSSRRTPRSSSCAQARPFGWTPCRTRARAR